MASIQITIDDRQVRDALSALVRRAGSPGPALKLIGETLAESTRRRFETSTAPDGSRWAPNSESTVEHYVDRFKASRTKTGKRSAAGRKRGGSKKPLIGESRSLSTKITYQVRGSTLIVGSPMEYAATQQFGARQGQYGRSRRGGPIPWGNIPARPFLGISEADRREILAILSESLGGPI